MIYSILRRSCICSFSKKLWSQEKSRLPFSLSVLYFSTSEGRKSGINPALYELLLHKHKFSPAVASHIVCGVSQSKPPERFDLMLSFLKEVGFTKAQLEKALKHLPQLLASDLEKTVKPKIKIFQDMGFSGKEIADLISREPKILHISANEKLIPRLGFLSGLLRSNKEVALVLRKSWWFLGSDLEKTMFPNIELLKSCGVSMEQIVTIFCYAPRFLLNKPEVVRKSVGKVDELGVSRSSKAFVYAVAVIGSMADGKWEQKLQAFRDILQCSEDDILRALRQAPQAFTVSEEKMRKVKVVLLGTGKYTTSCIVVCPLSLKYSIEQRYKPRIQVLEILERSHLIEAWPLLAPLCKMSDDMFYKKFVSPHLDQVGEVYLARRRRACIGKRQG